MSADALAKRPLSEKIKRILPQRTTLTKPQQNNQTPNKATISKDGEVDDEVDHNSPQQLQCMQDCEQYFHECEEFLELAKVNVDKLTVKPKKFVIGQKIREWRAKKAGNNLINSFDSLAQRGEELEIRLNTFIDNNLQGCQSLSFQAYTLQNRLQSCISTNQDRTKNIKPKMETLTVLLQQFSSYRNSLLQMITFFDEIQQQKDNEYVPWALRQVQEQQERENPHLRIQRTELEEEFEKVQRVVEVLEGISKQHEPEYITKTQYVGVGLYTLSDLELQLKDTMVWLNKEHPKQKAVAAATSAYVSSKSSTEKVNQNNPILFKTFQNPIMKKKTEAEVPPPPASPSTEDKKSQPFTFPELPPYDHSECQDCQCVISMAEKCGHHLSSKIASMDHLINLLEKLQKLRQEVFEEEKILESIDLNNGK